MKGELVLGVDFQKVTAEAKPRSAGQPRTAKPAVAQTRYEHVAEGMIERLNELGRRHQGKVQSLYDLINVMIERTPEPKR